MLKIGCLPKVDVEVLGLDASTGIDQGFDPAAGSPTCHPLATFSSDRRVTLPAVQIAVGKGARGAHVPVSHADASAQRAEWPARWIRKTRTALAHFARALGVPDVRHPKAGAISTGYRRSRGSRSAYTPGCSRVMVSDCG
jgi:hypothetical protein